jgi:hypothetical protein
MLLSQTGLVGIEFLVNKKEMGHIHGERLADLPFLIEVRKDFGIRTVHYPIKFIESGWVAIGSGIQTIYQVSGLRACYQIILSFELHKVRLYELVIT